MAADDHKAIEVEDVTNVGTQHPREDSSTLDIGEDKYTYTQHNGAALAPSPRLAITVNKRKDEPKPEAAPKRPESRPSKPKKRVFGMQKILEQEQKKK